MVDPYDSWLSVLLFVELSDSMDPPCAMPAEGTPPAPAAPPSGVDADAARPARDHGRQRRPEPHPSSDRIWLRDTLQ